MSNLMVGARVSKIKIVVAAGVPAPDAVRATLGMSIREFSEKYGLAEQAVSGVINGSTPYPYERVRDALAAELEVDRSWIDEHLPRPVSAANTPAGEAA